MSTARPVARVASRIGHRVGLATLVSALGASPVCAGDAPDRNGIIDPSIATSLPYGGDPAGLRRWLADHGVTYRLNYTNDVLANVRGGARTGIIDQGKLEAILAIDLEKLAGLRGLSFGANVFQIHNTGRIRRDYVGGINTIAEIEAVPATRLSEIWFEQKFWNGHASVRFGQLAADTEFFFAGLSPMFLQSDWPTITALNLPSGGAAYPLSTPAVRLKVDPTEDLSVMLAVFNGDPAGPGPGDEQDRNRHGLNFRVNDPPFIIGEMQLRTNQRKEDPGLATTVKLGGWVHLGMFDDQRFANDGRLLADPASSGVPARRHGNAGIYGVLDQQLYRPRGAGPDDGISVFGRVSASPSDRNPISFYLDAGIVFAGMLAGRPHDRFGANFMFARFSDSLRAFDRDQIAFSGVAGVVRDYEALLELTYVARIVPGWTVQPVVTHVWHPSGGVHRNALVSGVRSIWRF